MSDKTVRKQAYFSKLINLLEEYPRILIVGADNVGSSHMQQIRKSLRGKAVLLMGKNTMMRKAIKGHLSKNPALDSLLPHVIGNIGFVFTSMELLEIRNEVEKNKVMAIAKAGQAAPCNVIIPKGLTGLDPSQTSFMQALNIATKINKGQIEIINDVHLIKTGDRVGSSESTLLSKLNIKPFSFGLVPLIAYDSGSCFAPSILDLSDDDIIKKIKFGVERFTALSLEIGYPTLPALPHYFANAYKNILAVALATEYTFERAEKMKELLANPEALAAATAAATVETTSETTHVEEKAAPVEKEAPEKEAEEEEDVGFGDLFG